MATIKRSILIDAFCQQIRLQALKRWSVIAWFQSYFLGTLSAVVDERIVREGDRVSFTCDVLSSAGTSVLWLYTPGEAYRGVQHIYTEGRMVSGWGSRCQVTTNATSSTLALPPVHPNDAGYYECSEEHFHGKDVRLGVKLMVSDLAESTKNVAETIDVYNNVIFISGTSVVVLLIICALLVFYVALPMRRKCIKGKAVNLRNAGQAEMTNCKKTSPNWEIEDGATSSSLLLSQSVEKHPYSHSDRIVFLESDNDPKASRPEDA